MPPSPEGSGYSPTGHVGLSAMRERAEALGGYWTLHSAPGEGTRVEFCVSPEPTLAPMSVPQAAAADALAAAAAAAWAEAAPLSPDLLGPTDALGVGSGRTAQPAHPRGLRDGASPTGGVMVAPR